MTDFPPVTFALHTGSMIGCPPFPVLVFDDGASVAFHAVHPLAERLGLHIPNGSIFDLLQDWDRNFPALAELVQALAYSDLARGHRGEFVPSEMITIEALVPEARQVFRMTPRGAAPLPATAMTGPAGTVLLDDAMQQATPAPCLAAVIGKGCKNVDAADVHHVIAGWALGVEIPAPSDDALPRTGSAGSLIIGPHLVPAGFANKLAGIAYRFGVMGREIDTGDLGEFATQLAPAIAATSERVRLLPGDIVTIAADPSPDVPNAGAVDMIEVLAPGLGYLKISLK